MNDAKERREEGTLRFPGEPSGACPTYFRVNCKEAEESGDYSEAGYSLAIHLEEHLDCEEPLKALEILGKLEADDDALEWFQHYLPHCMEIIPEEGRESFMEGVNRAIDEGTLHLGPWIDVPKTDKGD